MSRGLYETFPDVSAAETDVFQFPIAELPENDKVCVARPARNFRGNHVIYEAAEAGQETTEGSSNR
jgi:hypothetical protein